MLKLVITVLITLSTCASSCHEENIRGLPLGRRNALSIANMQTTDAVDRVHLVYASSAPATTIGNTAPTAEHDQPER